MNFNIGTVVVIHIIYLSKTILNSSGLQKNKLYEQSHTSLFTKAAVIFNNRAQKMGSTSLIHCYLAQSIQLAL